jgi:hypothetical protein
MTVHIYSTLTSSQDYGFHKELPAGGVETVKVVHINGGHGLTNIHGIMLQGTETVISDEDYELLKTNHTYQVHVKNGFITVNKKMDIEKAISDLAQRDGSAPVTQEDVDALYDDGVIPVPLEEYTPEGKPRKRNNH